MNKLKLSGNTLITGDLATGKTTIFSYLVASMMSSNPDWQAFVCGNKEMIPEFLSSIGENRLSFKEVYEFPPEHNTPTVREIFDLLEDKRNQEKPLLIAIDETGRLFSEKNEALQFSEIIKGLNRDESKTVNLVMTVQNTDTLEKIFDFGFIFTFNNYIVLNNSREDFFVGNTILTDRIPRGEAVTITDQLDIQPPLLFTPGKPDSVNQKQIPEKTVLQRLAHWVRT